ncbi:MAG: (d)CMP kinase [Asticcacaulis sp.]
MAASLIIAFDGPAASGKGTLASVIAADYRLPFLDTGLLYRAVGVLGTRQGLSLDDGAALASLARHLDPALFEDPELRGRQAGEWASQVAALEPVRAALKAFQVDFAHQPSGAVLDGRDIGTVIAPEATVKLFITAAPEVRARRRWLQLVKADPALTFDAVLDDIRQRDARDSGRSSAPLVQAGDAVLLDTTEMDIQQATDAARRIVGQACARG